MHRRVPRWRQSSFSAKATSPLRRNFVIFGSSSGLHFSAFLLEISFRVRRREVQSPKTPSDTNSK